MYHRRCLIRGKIALSRNQRLRESSLLYHSLLKELCPANQPHVMFASQGRMLGQDTHAISNAAAFIWLEMDIIAIRTIQFAFGIVHKLGMMWNHLVIVGFSVNEFNTEVFGAETIRS